MTQITKFVIRTSEFAFDGRGISDIREFAMSESYQRECGTHAEFDSKDEALEALTHCCCSIDGVSRCRYSVHLAWMSEELRTLDVDGDEIEWEIIGEKVFADWWKTQWGSDRSGGNGERE